jgi:hypothetical protein
MLRSLSVAVLLLAPVACTYGEVEWGGDEVVGAEVRYESCNGDTWTTLTDTQGRYVFDGHANDAEAIPDGPYLVRVDLPGSGYYRLEHVDHVFTPCPDGSGKLCDRHDVDFGWKPLSGWEWGAWLDDLDAHNDVTYHTFHNEICIWTMW